MDKNSKNFDTSHTTSELFPLSPVKNTCLEVSFTTPDLSSDGGLLLMKEYERQTGFLNRVSDCISDTRSQLFVQHSYYEMLQQRIYQIAAGYEDADDSNFNTYGEQQSTLFNDYYGEYATCPCLSEGISGKMILPLLHPGRRNKSVCIYKTLRRVINRLRKVWKHTGFIIRGDSHFCCHELMDWDEEQFIESQKFIQWTCQQRGVYFITGLTGNKALSAITKQWVEGVQESFKLHGQPVCFLKHLYIRQVI